MPASSNAFINLIREIIASQGGTLSFADFMQLALYHPQLGYYCNPTFEFGREGDFTTAPEISPIFAYTLARQCEEIFKIHALNEILEIGAGSGQLAYHLLRALNEQQTLPRHYYIYEISASLRKKQQQYLKKVCPQWFDRITWLDQLPMDLSGIIIANEVLDALPVHCFKIENDQILERSVAWQDDRLIWKMTPPTHPLLTNRVQYLRDHYGLPEGYASEINLHLPNLITQMIHTLKRGVILLLDYGYGEREYYHPSRNKGTLTCFYQHQKHDDPLLYPGKEDITAHVDFTLVAENAIKQGATLLGYTTQAAFLLGCGLMTLAEKEEKKCDEISAFNLHQAIKLLTFPTEMGEVIKVMAIGKNLNENTDQRLMGFTLQDRTRDL